MKSIELQERDILMFEWISKFNVADKEILMEVLDMKSDSYFYERMRKLRRFNYIDDYRYDMYSSSVYFLKQLGVDEVIPPYYRESKKGNVYLYKTKPYSFNPLTYEHELIVSKIALKIMKDNPTYTLDSFITDREKRRDFNFKRKNQKISDLEIPEFGVKIEVELSTKAIPKLNDSFSALNRDPVIWFINRENKLLENRIIRYQKYNRDYAYNLEKKWKIYYVDELEELDLNIKDMYEKILKEEVDELDSRIKGTPSMTLEIKEVDDFEKAKADLLERARKEFEEKKAKEKELADEVTEIEEEVLEEGIDDNYERMKKEFKNN